MTPYLQTARSYLLGRQFDTCESWLLGLHDEYRRNPDSEAEAAAMRAGESALRSIGEATAQWLRKSPDSYAALMMRGHYLWACGRQARGSTSASQVSRGQWSRMHECFSEACHLFHRAALGAKNPGLALSMIGRMVWVGGDSVTEGLSFPGGGTGMRMAFRQTQPPMRCGWPGCMGCARNGAARKKPWHAICRRRNMRR
ncbi:hypothetical protein [Ottowia sp. VDI28]|uniref:hypothetical protein n=1 Tax=Ottowia sp. VDI28 TaxID=3133968 RepID=UPI003C309ACF